MRDLEKLESCPVCGSYKFSQFIDCKDFMASGLAFSILECRHCKLKFTCPRPPESNIAPYYASESYISHTETSKGLINKLYHFVRRLTIIQKVRLINSFKLKNKNILDFGAGTGNFLAALKKSGYHVSGIEPSEEARMFALKNNKVNLNAGLSFANFKPTSFSCITLWHVLEHVHQLNNTLEILSSLLTKNGVLLIAVPNAESHDAHIYKEYWAAYDVPRHLYHFTNESMSFLMKKHGFQIKKIRPMYFDSFYVSMLSEKYRGGNIFRAVFVGLASNILGLFNKRNFSSLIYIVQKR